MDRQVIEQKLESLRRCLQRVRSKCPPDAQTLAQDADLQDIMAINLSRAVQLAVDIAAHLIADMDVQAPGTMGRAFDLLAQQGVLSAELARQLKKSVGFRNIAVHNYDAINWSIVYGIVQNHLHQFDDYSRAIIEWLDDAPGADRPPAPPLQRH